jgi:coenzyme F420-reducing hydrogenase beta subunit
MRKTAEGFLEPEIDLKKCTNCGLCGNVCPVMNDSAIVDIPQKSKCFAVCADNDTRMHSSSGGVFTILAHMVLELGGYVCGAAFDDGFRVVRHIIVSDKKGLPKLRTSKYLQSYTGGVYLEIKNLLDNEKTVLFTGTPCQVAGLRGFLRQDYDKLITADVFCHGVPSPGVWAKYLDELRGEDKIKTVNFRDKSTSGWKQFSFLIESERQILANEPIGDNIYGLAFLQNLILRKCCTRCQFSRPQRVSDISLGDYWGIGKKHQDMARDDMGVSAVLANTSKGYEAIEKLKFAKFVESSFAAIAGGNPVLLQPCEEHKNRDAFFKDFAESGNSVIGLLERHLGKNDVALLSYSYSYFNYGAVLVSYAMENIFKKLGYAPQTIFFCPGEAVFGATEQSPFSEFRNKFLNMSGVCHEKGELQAFINPAFENFAVGSDQVFRGYDDFNYLLDWVCGKKRIISYAASFGIGKIDESWSRHKNYAAQCLRRFDALSVREQSGVDILQNEFGIKSQCHIDPTLLLDAADYRPIIEDVNTAPEPEEYIAFYLLDREHLDVVRSRQYLPDLKNKYKFINVRHDESNSCREVYEFLRLIRGARHVITDSFHGSVFSIIFRKNFAVVTTKDRGNERLENLFDKLALPRAIFCDDLLEISEDILNAPIDWQLAARNLDKERSRAFDFLKNALAAPLTNKKAVKRKTNLFGFLPISIRRKPNRTIYRLFGLLPLLVLRYKENGIILRLFGFIKIGRIER